MMETKKAEQSYLHMLMARATHADEVVASEQALCADSSAGTTTTSNSTDSANSTSVTGIANVQMMNRLITDFMLRIGDNETAKKFADETNTTVP
jgi:hypothetical protein